MRVFKLKCDECVWKQTIIEYCGWKICLSFSLVFFSKSIVSWFCFCLCFHYAFDLNFKKSKFNYMIRDMCAQPIFNLGHNFRINNVKWTSATNRFFIFILCVCFYIHMMRGESTFRILIGPKQLRIASKMQRLSKAVHFRTYGKYVSSYTDAIGLQPQPSAIIQ